MPEENCHNTNCKCVPHDRSSVLCCHLTGLEELSAALNCSGVRMQELKRIHVRNWNLEELNLNFTRPESELRSLAVTDGNVSRVTGEFPHHVPLACLNLSGNALTDLASHSLRSLTQLRNLDLSRNNLTLLPWIHTRAKNLTVDISENRNLNCSPAEIEVRRLQNLSVRFRNEDGTKCVILGSNTSPTEVSLFQMISKKLSIKEECPQGNVSKCRCGMGRVQAVLDKPIRLTAYVDCSGQNLTELPSTLPSFTTSLNVSNNNITSLKTLYVNKDYEHIQFFYADFNNISSIQELEGSRFMNQFVYLSLRGNSFRSLQTYIFTSGLRNPQAAHLFLGQNRLRCDCAAAQITKVWLNKNNQYVHDYDKVLCEDGKKLVDLDQNQVCRSTSSSTDWMDYIYYIIAAEVILLMFLVAKVSYDYWVFKTAGYLPWPASRMPKLPCDWVFES